MRSLVVILLCYSTPLAAAQVVTTYDKVRLNWSQLRLEFTGTGNGGKFAELENLAWQDGWQRLKRVLPRIYAQHYPTATGTTTQAVADVFRHLHLRETVFSQQRWVRITFSSTLPHVFSPAITAASANSVGQLGTARNSGVILRAVRSFPPRAVYEIRGRSGRRYFDVSMVQQKHFQRGLMGRYFRNLTAAQLVRYVGRKPQQLLVREIAPAVLEVDDVEWQKFVVGNESVLARARIVFIFGASE